MYIVKVRVMSYLLSTALILAVAQSEAQQSLYVEAQKQTKTLEALQEENAFLRQDINLTAAEIQQYIGAVSVVLQESSGVDAGSQLKALPQLAVVPIRPISLSPEEEEATIRLIMDAPGAIPQFVVADYFAIALAGGLAAAYDIFLVATPSTSLLSKNAKTYTLKLHEDYLSKLEAKFKVPFDRFPKGPGHRGKSLGHDPFAGLVFGVYDIMTGRSTYIDKGRIISIATPGYEGFPLANSFVRWMGHLLSDVGTKHGLPLPGWNLLQLAEI